PGNDMFASAVAVSGASGSTAGSNVGATKEAGEPGLAGNSGGASVWWRWTSPYTGSATVTTAGSSFDTLLGVFTGSSVGALTLVADNDDVSGTDKTSAVSFAAAAGTTYMILVDGYLGPQSGQAAGAISVNWNIAAPPSPPANDMFANAAPISGASGSASGTNVAATKASGAPGIACSTGGASVWYRWTSSSAGSATITTA